MYIFPLFVRSMSWMIFRTALEEISAPKRLWNTFRSFGVIHLKLKSWILNIILLYYIHLFNFNIKISEKKTYILSFEISSKRSEIILSMISVGIRSLMTAKNESELDSVVLKALLVKISITDILMFFSEPGNAHFVKFRSLKA